MFLRRPFLAASANQRSAAGIFSRCRLHLRGGRDVPAAGSALGLGGVLGRAARCVLRVPLRQKGPSLCPGIAQRDVSSPGPVTRERRVTARSVGGLDTPVPAGFPWAVARSRGLALQGHCRTGGAWRRCAGFPALAGRGGSGV